MRADEGSDRDPAAPRRLRVDAQRNVEALLLAAKSVFATSGVEAPAKEITDRAGVGVGTLYRHFPRRADLIAAVLEAEIDACADAGPQLSATHAPGEALSSWLLRYTEFLATKHGLASALHSGDSAYDALRDYFLERLGPTAALLLDAATTSGEIRADVSPKTLLYAVAKLCVPAPDEDSDDRRLMVSLLVDGLRYRMRDDRP